MGNPVRVPVTVGIAGGTGAGKTAIVKRLTEKYADRGVAVLDQDSYYRDRSPLSPQERAAVNFDEPSALDHDLILAHVEELRRGNSVKKPCYSFVSHTRTGKFQVIRPAELIIVEGIFALHDPRLRGVLDVKLFVHADADVRFIRRLERDIRDRGRTVDSVISQYVRSVRPMHDQYIEPTKAFADLVLMGTVPVDRAIEQVEEMIATARDKKSNPSG
jgi:uridine kinase